MKHSAAIAHVRALCGLGIPAEQLVPAVLEALHQVVPSSRNLFDWSDRKGNLVRYYFEGSIDHAVARHYFEHFYNRREAEAMPTFRESVTGPATIRSAADLDHPEFYRSALYNEIWRPQGLHRRVELIVRGSRDQSLGSLVLYRGPSDAAFTKDEEGRLAAVAPYLARALERETEPHSDYVPRGDRHAVLSLSPDGELLHLSQDAQKVLLLAHGGITPESVARHPDGATYPTLQLLVQQLRWAANTSRPTASVTVDNNWGRFVFDAESLTPLASGAPPLIHVSVQHHEARAVRRRRAAATLPISATQREVCLLLCTGRTQAEIAEALHVAPSTVADHIKKVYERLDVHSARELRQLIE